MRKFQFALTGLAAVLFVAGPAVAQDTTNGAVTTEETAIPMGDDDVSEAAVPTGTARPASIIANNVAVEIGGGLSTFTDDLGEALDGGASFTGRAILGTRSMLGIEVGYFGAVNGLDTVNNEVALEIGNVDSKSTVYSNSAELLGRVNLAGSRWPVRPFIAGGVSWYRLDSDLEAFDDSDAMGFPLAAGVQIYPWQFLTVGLRGDYKVLTDPFSNDFPGGDQYGGTLTVGAAF